MIKIILKIIEENPNTEIGLTRLEAEIEEETKTLGEEILAEILSEAIQKILEEIKENSGKFTKIDHKKKSKNKKKFN